MSEFTPGEGWRLIDIEKDTPEKGDQAFCGPGRWKDRNSWFRPFNKSVVYRRRIPASPERLVLKEVTASICHRKKKPETWKVVASIDVAFPGTGYLDGDEARQLADWLTRFADWLGK